MVTLTADQAAQARELAAYWRVTLAAHDAAEHAN